MEIEVSTHGGAVVAALVGEIDSSTAPKAQEELVPLIGEGKDLILDMTRLTFLSSAGLRILLLLYRQAEANNRKVALAGPSENVKDTMEITGFLTYFVVCDTVEEALSAVGA
jgi:anti-sigma B factor antagonist